MKYFSFGLNTLGIWSMGYFVFDYFGFKVMDYPYMDIVLIVLWTILSAILSILFQLALHTNNLKVEYKLQNELNIAIEKQLN
jgi:cell shape-determining protein MreD